MGRTRTGILLAASLVACVLTPLGAAEYVAVIRAACETGSYMCMARDAVVLLQESYPDHTFEDAVMDPSDCPAWMARGNASGYHAVVTLGTQWDACTSAAAPTLPATWFLSVDGGCVSTAPNAICVSFDEGQVAFAAGYLAGLLTQSKVAGMVAGVPLPAVKRSFNGFAQGLATSCPGCRLEGGFATSLSSEPLGAAMAEELMDLQADVVFGTGGPVSSAGIRQAAELGALVIGAGVDEFFTTFAQGTAKQVRGKLVTSGVKRADTAIQIAVSILLGAPAGSHVGGITRGRLLMDYASGAVGLADCHRACGAVGVDNWQAAKRVERELGLGLLSMDLTPDGSVPLPSGLPLRNTFVPAPVRGRAPPARTQHAAAALSGAYLRRLVVFGGVGADGGLLGDLWLYEVDVGKWTSGASALTTGVGPPPLAKACAVGLGRSLFIFGGRTKDDLQSNRLYSFTDQLDTLGSDSNSGDIRFRWASVAVDGALPLPVEGSSCAALNATCFATFGGRSAYGEVNSVYRFCADSPSVGRWTRLWPGGLGGGGDGAGLLPAPRELAGVAALRASDLGLPLAGGALVVVGGTSLRTAFLDAWALDLEAMTWMQLPALPAAMPSQPLVFSVQLGELAAGQPRELVVAQLTSTGDAGIGALVLDWASRSWFLQAGGFANGSAGGVSFAGAARAANRTWLFGGSHGKVPVSDLYVAEFGVQRVCGKGQQAHGMVCVACAQGSASPGGGQPCTRCIPGKAAHGGAGKCYDCDAGRFSSAGQAACMACPAGRSTERQRGAAECTECGFGLLAAEGAAECADCPVGSYGADRGATACLQCPGDLTTQYPGAADADKCACPKGTYRALQEDSLAAECKPCPHGMHCPFGSDMRFMGNGSKGAFPLVLQGFMTLADDVLCAYTCARLEHCPGGLPASCGAYRDNAQVACGSCVEGAYDDGQHCQPCDGASVAPFICLVVVCAAGTVLSSGLLNRELYMQTHAKLNMLVIVGMAITAVQTLGIFAQLAIKWPDPLTETLGILSLLCFDLKLFQLSCVMGTDQVRLYVIRQMVAPSCAVLVMLTLLVKRRLRPGIRIRRELVNCVGTVFNVFFISIVLSCMAPLVCYAHPGVAGRYSMRSSPSVLCFAGGEHTSMLIISAVAFVTVPLPFVALVAYGTLHYPTLVAKVHADGAEFLQVTRFLFFKFKPERYYYGTVSLLRSLLICAIPVAIRDEAPLQVLATSTVLLVFAQAQQYLHPWREDSTNVLDGAISVVLVLLLTSGALSGGFATDMGSIRTLNTVVFAIFVTLAAGSIFWSIRRMCRGNLFYHHFMCHHKADAGAQARLLKLLIEAATGENVFIDSDNLKNLDGLFDILRRSVGQIIVYLTRETLSRPWCAGEIATAFKTSRIKVISIRTPSFRQPSEAQIQDLDSYLDLTDCNLLQYDIAKHDIQESYRYLLDKKSTCVVMRADAWGSNRFKEAVEDMLRRSPMGLRVSGDRPAIPDRADMVVISVEPHDDEAVAAAGIIMSMPQVQVQMVQIGVSGICALCDFDFDDVVALSRLCLRARAVLVLLSAGSLQSLTQLVALVEVMGIHGPRCTEGGQASPVVPVALPGFHFPPEDYYLTTLPRILPVARAEEQLRAFFRVIAAPFATHAADQVLEAQARELTARISQRAPPPPAAVSSTTELRRI